MNGITRHYYERLTQAAMVLANPQVPGEIKELVVRESMGAKLLMDRIVQSFDIKSIDVVVPSLIGDKNGQGNGAASGAGPAAGNGAGGPPDGQLANVPGAPRGAEGAGPGGVEQ